MSNASHANSVMDIVLGSFRYCINNPKNKDAARHMMGRVVDILWHSKEGDKYHMLDKGLIVRPEMPNIKSPTIKAEYNELFRHINELLNESTKDNNSVNNTSTLNSSQTHNG